MNFHQLYENYMLMLYLVKFDYSFLITTKDTFSLFFKKG